MSNSKNKQMIKQMTVSSVILEKNCTIYFSSELFFEMGSKLEIIYNDKKRYFEIKSISAFAGQEILAYEANEVGYFAGFLVEEKEFDPRSIIGVEITKITDEEKIKSIEEAKRWC